MDYNQDTKFIFCPRCGGIMQPPVCNICGYDLRHAPEPVYSDFGEFSGEGNGMPVMQDGQADANAQIPGGEASQGMNAQSMPNPNAQNSQEMNAQNMANPNGQIPPRPQNMPNPNGQLPPNAQNLNDPNAKKLGVNNTEPKKKKKVWIPIAIAGTVILILVVLCGPILSTVGVLGNLIKTKKTAQLNPPSSSSSSKPKTSQSDSEDDSELPENLEYEMRHFGRFDHQGLDTSFYENMADCKYTSSSGVFDPYLNQSGHVETWLGSGVFDNTHRNYTVDEMGPDYYEPFCDAIDEVSYSEQYQVSRKYFYYDDLMGNYRIQAAVAYPQLSGDIPNLDQLNQEIYDRCASDYLNYLNGSSPYSQYVFERILFATDSYITYNDGKKMSILLDCAVHTDDYWNCLDSYIYAINIDLEKGKIIENDQILDMDEAFAKEFRERCLTQNGSNSALDPLTDKEVLQYLSDKENNIMFFTPLGLEVGMHYVGKDDILARGWMTITLKYGEFENKIKDQSLLNKGNATRIRNDLRYADLVGGWTEIDEELGAKEEEEVRKLYPNYDWSELTMDEELAEREKAREEAEKNSNGTTVNPDDPDWWDDYQELQDYFNNPQLYGDSFEADQYFKLHKGDSKDKDKDDSEKEDASEIDSEEESEKDKEKESEKDSEKDSEKESEKDSGNDTRKKGGFVQ